MYIIAKWEKKKTKTWDNPDTTKTGCSCKKGNSSCHNTEGVIELTG